MEAETMTGVAEVVLLSLAGYAAVGLLFGVPFVLWGVGRVDESARGTSLSFRLLILPGVVAFWPILAWRWVATRKGVA
jgi:hypothetical protein